MDILSPALLAYAVTVTLVAGFVKGAVGFAFPLVMVSGLSALIDPRLAVAALILPTVASNLTQVARAGMGEAWAALRGFWRYVLAVAVMVLVVSQLLARIPERGIYAALGVPIAAVALVQLSGWRFSVPAGQRAAWDVGVGAVAGTVGGVAGVWGPPTVLYLLALDVPRARHMAVQGVVYSVGAVMLLAGHLRSGLLNAETAPLSALMLVPMWIGMWAGMRAGDRLDAARFRRWTLVVLVVAGLNLIRRAVMG